MKTILLLLALSVATVRAELSKIEALGMIETGENDDAVGKAGEVSRYQIRPYVWHKYSHSEAYRDRRVSTVVAGRHLAALERTFLRQTGRSASDFDIYVLWNAGPTYYARIGFSQARVHPIIRQRATRYVNLRQIDRVPAAVAPLAVVAESVADTAE